MERYWNVIGTLLERYCTSQKKTEKKLWKTCEKLKQNTYKPYTNTNSSRQLRKKHPTTKKKQKTERYWNIVGTLLEHCWNIVGTLLERYWSRKT